MKHNKTINNNGGFNNAVYRGSTAAYENSYQCLVYELALGFCPYSPFFHAQLPITPSQPPMEKFIETSE